MVHRQDSNHGSAMCCVVNYSAALKFAMSPTALGAWRSGAWRSVGLWSSVRTENTALELGDDLSLTATIASSPPVVSAHFAGV
jgi:hypothetical protein